MAEHSTQTIVNRPDAPGVLTSYVLAFGAIAAAVPASLSARPVDGRRAAARHAVRRRRRCRVGGRLPPGDRRRDPRLPRVRLPVHRTSRQPGRRRSRARGRPAGVSLHLCAHHRVRRGDAARADARQRAARAVAGDAAQHRRRRHHHRRRRPRHLHERRGRVADRLDADGSASASRSTRCSGSSTRTRAGRSRTRRRRRFGKGSSSAWRITRC